MFDCWQLYRLSISRTMNKDIKVSFQLTFQLIQCLLAERGKKRLTRTSNPPTFLANWNSPLLTFNVYWLTIWPIYHHDDDNFFLYFKALFYCKMTITIYFLLQCTILLEDDNYHLFFTTMHYFLQYDNYHLFFYFNTLLSCKMTITIYFFTSIHFFLARWQLPFIFYFNALFYCKMTITIYFLLQCTILLQDDNYHLFFTSMHYFLARWQLPFIFYYNALFSRKMTITIYFLLQCTIFSWWNYITVWVTM